MLGKKLDLPVMKCIDEDWPFAFATDFNPNCPITSLPMIGSLATHRIGIEPIAALAAVSRNPASTMFQDTGEVRGVVKEGCRADLNILWSPSADSWCQTPGTSPISYTIKNGDIVNSNSVY